MKKTKNANKKKIATLRKKRSKQNDVEIHQNWVEDQLDWVALEDFHLHPPIGEQLSEEEEEEEEEEHEESQEIDDFYVADNSKGTDHGIPQNQQQHETFHHDGDQVQTASAHIPVKIVSWNVLAESYCHRSSHPDLPPQYQKVIFDRKRRTRLIHETLQHIITKTTSPAPDLFALQEVDPPLGIATFLREHGYDAVETDNSRDGRIGRVDSCGLYYCTQHWKCLDHETIHLDDLSVLRSREEAVPEGTTSTEEIRKLFRRSSSLSVSSDQPRQKYHASLQGLQCSLVRKNVALIVRLEHVSTRQTLVVVVAHLFWNPAYEYVKLCQMHYIAKRCRAFSSEKEDETILLCGDFNSQPGSSVHRYLSDGSVNAKRVAPWYALSSQKQPTVASNEAKDDSTIAAADVRQNITTSSTTSDRLNSYLQQLSLATDEEEESSTVGIRYMLDFTLNKFCRWMRILGIDAALETDEEEQERTKHGRMVIFDRCLREGRALVTTSNKLLQRKDCPPGTYLLDTKSLLNLEQTLVQLLLAHGVKLLPNNFLTRCVVCNGSIEEVFDEAQKKRIFQAHQAPEEVHEEVLGVYQCDMCQQGYWWCEKPTSSASRVKSQATWLLETCIRGGVQVGGDLGMFDFVDVDKIREEGKEEGGSTDDNGQLDVVGWLQDENLKNPLESLSSVYASPETKQESLPFTNVTSGFVGALDFIFYKKDSIRITDLLYVPRTYVELNSLGIPRGHFLPSCHWPSDHLAIGCALEVQFKKDSLETQAVPPDWCTVLPPKEEATPAHGNRCGCGCVPAIPSLFEMAELRKQARLNQLQQKNNSFKV